VVGGSGVCLNRCVVGEIVVWFLASTGRAEGTAGGIKIVWGDGGQYFCAS